MSTATKARGKGKDKRPCPNCTPPLPPGHVVLSDDEGSCFLCGADLASSAQETYTRGRIAAQAERLEELLESHNALSGHMAQSMLAADLLHAAQRLVAAHDALAAARLPKGYEE